MESNIYDFGHFHTIPKAMAAETQPRAVLPPSHDFLTMEEAILYAIHFAKVNRGHRSIEIERSGEFYRLRVVEV